MSEKTEQPTSKRLRDARKKGQVAKSVDVTAAVQLCVIVLLFVLCGEGWYRDILQLLAQSLVLIVSLAEGSVATVTLMWVLLLARIVGIVAGSLIAATIGILLAQAGFLISFEIFAKAGSKLNVIANLKQMFSARNLFELLKSLMKVMLVGLIFYTILQRQFSSFQYLPICGIRCAFPLMSHLCFELFMGLLAGYILFGTVDYIFQRRTLMKQLRMTKEEVKQEYKDSEGNPEIKQRRRESHREMQHDNLQQKVRKSSVVIKNPTHISVCLWFDKTLCPLPKVIEKASGKRALEISVLAEREGIPLVENIPLARGLMRSVEVGEYITQEYFDPVAEILRMVMDLPYDPEPLEP
ncbi:EscU/YscU/HrcU family type III secretion system export apparatus switch protein [Enterobacteriaceae bacterium H20N1]|uniref:EscU/YscU/HrcU family type III secretion system export apparatus switch protein n=1 Tax=Dryocola boscaweniae TaxID=2925397 RepID=A0A9X2W4Q0_9ENTR|nr:EscU/YscU/HrcU family type III secretion system export apparatus switch protein [Dryocola boscaweniae]MCT4700532.1 EscU/YscU/HrcU family type III secretion system export apparatus switch protein [Dryocola boscaweniae]MCT4717688.1 EscU/YscU/HrcU family type III secretion system export apparatus switch protein [Dryocola boscaweniae]